MAKAQFARFLYYYAYCLEQVNNCTSIFVQKKLYQHICSCGLLHVFRSRAYFSFGFRCFVQIEM